MASTIVRYGFVDSDPEGGRGPVKERTRFLALQVQG
jgi:hypothetical protein